MAIIYKGEKLYPGAVLYEEEHMWMDGMLDVHTVVWDINEHTEKRIHTGYYGSDGQNMIRDYQVEFEVSREVARDILHTMKRDAVRAICNEQTKKRNTIEPGIVAEVVRGRKYQKGLKGEVFWVGKRPTYKSRYYSWMQDYELIAGMHDENGNKIWIKAEYLKRMTPVPALRADERKAFIKRYVETHARREVLLAARKEEK